MFWEIDLCFGKPICVLGNCFVFWKTDLCLTLLGHRTLQSRRGRNNDKVTFLICVETLSFEIVY